MARKSTLITSAVGAAAGLVLAGGAVLSANAAENSPAATATSSSATAPTVQQGSSTQTQGRAVGQSGQQGQGGPMGGSQATPVTGDEADKVIAALKAKDATASITEVRKDPDGSYDALGTKDGAPVFYEVSADLSTVTENTGGPMGGPGGHQDGQAPGQVGQGGPAGQGAPTGGTLDPNTATSSATTGA